jgi:DNA-binding transcriptional LysR family regulator
VLRCGIPVGTAPHALVPLLTMVHAHYPRLAVLLRHIDDPLTDSIDDLDMLLHFGNVSPPGNWLAYQVLRMREWLLASTDYLARRGTPRTLDELADHDLLAWTPPGEDGRLLPLRAGEGLEIDPILLSPDVHLLRQCVIAGIGIGYVPDGMLPDPGIEPGTLVPIFPDLVGRDRPLQLLVPSALAGQPKLRVLLKHIQSFMSTAVVPG